MEGITTRVAIRRRWTVAAAVLLPLAAMACGGGGDDSLDLGSADETTTTTDAAERESTTTTTEPQVETVRIGETAYQGDFQIEVDEATFEPIAEDGAGNLSVTMALTNLSDENLGPDWQNWSLEVGSNDSLPADAGFAEQIPAGGSNEVEVGWYIDEGFSFDDAVLVFGAQDANGARVPLGGGEVETDVPFTSAVAGTITVPDVSVVLNEARVSANYEYGNAGKFNVRLPVTVTVGQSPGGIYVGKEQFTLTTPNGDTVLSPQLMSHYLLLCCEVLNPNPYDTVLGFIVDEPVEGDYTLSYVAGPGAEPGSVTFTVTRSG